MSSHDDRIVRMGFDNAKFESGASKTMSTLDKLNEKLKLKGASDGSKNIEKAFSGVNFSAIEKGITALEKRFSTMGIISMNVVNKITDSVLSSAKKIEEATLGQIKAGGWARAMNIANAKFQIEGLGFEWNKIEDSVNYGVKDTAYGLDAAATAASQLAASGVDFQKVIKTVNGQGLTAMHKSLRAISGVAAMTDSSYEDIARIFTTVAGNGRLMGDQLLQLSSRGMNAAAKLAETLHTTESEVRDMVSKGKIDFQTFAFAMDDAFGAHAKEANKTFTGALGNMKAALSRVGEIFASPVINKTNTLFISLTGRIDELKNKLKSVEVPRSFDEIADKYKNISTNAAGFDEILKFLGNREIRFADDFAEMWQSGVNAFSSFIKALDAKWFDTIVAKADGVIVKLKEFFDLVDDYFGESVEDTAKDVNDATKSLKISAKEAEAARQIIEGKSSATTKKLTEMFGEQGAKNIEAYIKSVKKAGGNYDKAKIKVITAAEEMKAAQEKAAKEAKKEKLKKVIDTITTSLSNLWRIATNFAEAGKKIASVILKSFGQVFGLNFNTVTDGVQSFTDAIARLSDKLILGDEGTERLGKVFTVFFKILKYGIGLGKKAFAYVDNLIVRMKASKKVSNALDSFGRSLKNIWITVTNVAKAIGKISGAIFKAFAKVFNINLTSVSTGVETFTEKLARLSEKLIISDATADKVTRGFTKVFEVIKKGLVYFKKAIKYVGDLFKQFKNGKIVDTLKEKFQKFFHTISDHGVVNTIKKSPIGFLLAKLFDGIKFVLSESKDIPSLIVGLFDKIVAALLSVDWVNVFKLTGLAGIFYTLFRFFSSLGKIGKAIDAVAGIPVAIKSFFSNMGKAFKMGGKAVLRLATAESIKIIAESIIMVIAALLAATLVDPESLRNAGGVFIAVAAVFVILLKVVQKMADVGDDSKSAIGSITALLNTIRLVGAAATMMLSMAASVVAISIALAIIQKSGAASVKNMAMLAGILGALTGVVVVIMKLFNKVSTGDLLKYAGALTAVTLLFGVLSVVLLAVTALMAVSKSAPPEVIAAVVGGISAIFLVIALVTKIISKQKPSALLAAAVTMVSMGVAFQMMFVAIGTALAIVAGSIVALSTAGVSDIKGLLIGFVSTIVALITSMIFIVKLSKNADLKSIVGKGSTVAALVSLFGSVSWMIKQLAEAVATVAKEKLSPSDLASVTLSLMSIILSVGILIKMVSDVDSTKLLALSGAFTLITLSLVNIAIAIIGISRFAKADTMLEAAVGLAVALIGIGLAIGLASSVLTKNKNSASNIIAGMLSIAAVLLVIGHVFSQLKDVQNLTQQALVIGSLITVIGGVVTLMMAAFSKNQNGGADTMLAVGGSFLLVAASMVILAAAMKEVAGMGSEITTAAIAFGIFAGAIVVLAVISAIIPQFSAGMMTVGKAFLFAGIGAALVGAGFWLMSEAVKNLSGHLDEFFETIEDHWAVALGFSVVLIAMTAIIMKSIDKVATVLAVGYMIVKDIFASIKKLFTSAAKDGKSWLSKAQNKGKVAIVAMIVTLCSALGKASPTIIQTIGDIILKTLDYLAKIAPAIINKVVVLIINLLYGLAKAISANASRITSAVRAVLESLVVLILEGLATLLDMVASMFMNIPIIGELIGGALEGASEMVRDGADEISKDIDRLSKDSEKGIKEIDDSTGILNTALTNSGIATGGLTDKLNEYASSLGIAKDGVEALTAAEETRVKKVGSTKSNFQEAYDNATDIERRRYDEYAKLDDAVEDARAKYDETVNKINEYKRQEAKAKAEYDAMVQSESDPKAIEEARYNWRKWQSYVEDGPIMLDAANQILEEAQKKANEYYDKYKDILSTLYEAREQQKDIWRTVNDPNRVKDEYRLEAFDELSRRLEAETGNVEDFAALYESGATSRLKGLMQLYDLNDAYNDILSAIVKKYEEQERADIEAEEKADQDSLQARLKALETDIARHPTKYTGPVKTLVQEAIGSVKDQMDSDETNKDIDEVTDVFGGSYRDSLDRSLKTNKSEMDKSVKTNTVDSFDSVLGISNGTSSVGNEQITNYTQGMMDGYDDNAGILNQYTKSFGQTNIVDAMNETLDEHSPSKEGAKSGKFFVLGIIKGLTDTTSELDTTTGGIGNKLIQAFTYPLNYISSLMNGDLEYDPTIRPVVDSSNLTRSAASINNAFQTGTIDVGQFSGQLAADINSLRRNDNAIVDELKLLREDINTMSDEISSMQMILDTGVLVGEISSGVDRQLGARSIFKKRGI